MRCTRLGACPLRQQALINAVVQAVDVHIRLVQDFTVPPTSCAIQTFASSLHSLLLMIRLSLPCVNHSLTSS